MLRIRDVFPDPHFIPSRISDLGPQIQEQQKKKGERNLLDYIFLSHKFTKSKII